MCRLPTVALLLTFTWLPVVDCPGLFAQVIEGVEDPAWLKPLEYRSIGPAWGGRVSRAAGVAGNPNIYFAATASGGVWRSQNGGTDWEPVFDEQPTSSIGSLAIAPSDPNVIYVGSGEANIRGNVAAGNGIYKSSDGGATWQHVWKQEGQIGTMVVHPNDPDVAYAAVLGHAFGPNPERGIYRTRDGGKSWKQVLGKDHETGASDVAIDPSNPRVLFAGFWQTRRKPWTMTSGGPGSGLYYSNDGGDSWEQLREGLPEGIWGKVGIAIAPSDGRRVYALIEAEDGGLFRSDDGGKKWTRVNGDRRLRQRAWYYSTMTVHPSNPDEVWCPQVSMLRSIDGGKNFTFVKGIHHADNHDVWFDPANPKRMIVANDGGVDITRDGGETWYAPPLPICQLYHVSVDTRDPFYVAGTLQDIGTAQGPSNSLSEEGIHYTEWFSVGGGEAGWVVSDPADPNIVYAGEYMGYISRYDHRTGQAQNVSVYPENASGHGGEALKYRFQWTAPIVISPHDSQTVYHGANILFRTVNGGQTWESISPDLTRDDESKQKWSGGPITGDNTGVEVYGTIFAVAESPLKKGLIWVGSDDGLVHITLDNGKEWEDVTANIPGLPEWGTVSMIEASQHEDGAAYLTVDAHRLDNMEPYLYKTRDFGETWQRLDSTLPRDIYLHAVREDPVRPGLLYVGTERGVVFSQDDGASWHSLRLNLPTVAVHDLQVKENSLVVGTHGRSVWIFDDLNVLRDLDSEIQQKRAFLFAPPVATRWLYRSEWDGGFSGKGALGKNPPEGALLYYWLREKPRKVITLEIFDEEGRLVRTLSSEALPLTGFSEYAEEEKEVIEDWVLPTEEGVNRTSWDLRWTGAEMFKGGILDFGYPRVGPMALPGEYRVVLKVGEEVESAQLSVRADPRQQVEELSLHHQLDFALEVRNTITSVTRSVEKIRGIRKQLREHCALLEGNSEAGAIIGVAERLQGLLDEIEGRLHNTEALIAYDILAQKGGAKLYARLDAISLWTNSADGAPPQGMQELFADQKEEVNQCLRELDEFIANALADYNREASRLSFPTVYLGSG